jgi:hypothetical protein
MLERPSMVTAVGVDALWVSSTQISNMSKQAVVVCQTAVLFTGWYRSNARICLE